uniref:Uncharacterized protein n=1 Tax=Setaria viridis TaxID=4556 RepID=A0A4U6W823_SETVI|nr:hypothetical protein SEVIR_1G061450v2 [Setaria viridis]
MNCTFFVCFLCYTSICYDARPSPADRITRRDDVLPVRAMRGCEV